MARKERRDNSKLRELMDEYGVKTMMSSKQSRSAVLKTAAGTNSDIWTPWDDPMKEMRIGRQRNSRQGI